MCYICMCPLRVTCSPGRTVLMGRRAEDHVGYCEDGCRGCNGSSRQEKKPLAESERVWRRREPFSAYLMDRCIADLNAPTWLRPLFTHEQIQLRIDTARFDLRAAELEASRYGAGSIARLRCTVRVAAAKQQVRFLEGLRQELVEYEDRVGKTVTWSFLGASRERVTA